MDSENIAAIAREKLIEVLQNHMRVAMRKHFNSTAVAEVIADDAVDEMLSVVKAQGLVVVPVEPTEAMVEAGKAVPCDIPVHGGVIFSTATEAVAIYTAMLAAAGDAP